MLVFNPIAITEALYPSVKQARYKIFHILEGSGLKKAQTTPPAAASAAAASAASAAATTTPAPTPTPGTLRLPSLRTIATLRYPVASALGFMIGSGGDFRYFVPTPIIRHHVRSSLQYLPTITLPIGTALLGAGLGSYFSDYYTRQRNMLLGGALGLGGGLALMYLPKLFVK